jgi:hypothetical protein
MTRRVLPLRALIRDSRVQPREAINLTTVSEYAQAMAKAPVYRAAGLDVRSFPPVVVFHEVDHRGNDLYWLADGWHRALAAEEAGLETFDAEVHEGGVYDAILYAAGANAAHGLRRTNRDKHRAVRMVLDHPTVIREEWGNARVAHAAGVSDFLVKTVRRERELELGLTPSTERRGQDGKLYSLQLRHDRKATSGPERATSAPEAPERATGSGAPITNGSAPVAAVEPEAFLHQCKTDGCDAVTTEESWHCDDCGAHLPIRDYPVGVECPVCVGDPLAEPLSVLARVEHVEMPKAERNGTTQAPYTPGTMKPPGAVLALERLVAVLDLIDSLAEHDFGDIIAESPDPDRLLARVRVALTTLHTLSEQYGEAGVMR